MAGHSKWANIKHRKGKADAQKGKMFTRVAKEIINAVKLGGPDHKGNPRLRLALQKAKEVNMPSDNVERLIKKASNADTAAYEEMQYELYGHGGVGIIVDAMCSNKNRITSDLRVVINKKGGTIAHPGAVAYNFDRKAIITIAKKNALEKELFEAIIEAGADDFTEDAEQYIVIADPAHLIPVKEAIEKLGFACEASVEMVPKTYIACTPELTKANLELIQWLENVDDVDVVYHNMKMDGDEHE